MATMKDVAAMAKVSITTVSHVVNGTRFVSEEVRERVCHAMEELGYQPNVMARGLRRGESSMIGLIVPDVTNPYFAEIARSVEDACAELGYGLVLCNSDGRSERQRRAVEVLASNRVGGLVLVNVGMTDRETALFKGLSTPMVMLDRDLPGSCADFIQVDNVLGGRQATAYLIGLGHRRIACLSGPSAISPSVERLKGYREAMEEAGLVVDPELVLGADFTPEGGFSCARRLITLGKSMPTALFACNDMMAFGAVTAFAEVGYRVPEDVSVVGFDDIRLASFFNPALTTVKQPREEMGRRAVEILVARMHKTCQFPCRRISLEPELMIRRSACPPGTK